MISKEESRKTFISANAGKPRLKKIMLLLNFQLILG